MDGRETGRGEPRTGRRFGYANVMATVAVFIALGGGAYATHTHRMGTQDLQNRAVTAPKVANGAVITRAIRNGAVRPAKIRNRAVRPRHLADNAIRTRHLAPQTGGPRAFARVNDTGTVAASGSRGIGSENIIKGTTEGRYCLTDLPFEPRSIQLTGISIFGGSDGVVATGRVRAGGFMSVAACGGEVQGWIDIYDSEAGEPADGDFHIWLMD